MKKTISQIVSENKERVLQCGTPSELYMIAKELGFDNRAAFPRYKKALQDVCGIDYDAVRATREEQRAIMLAESVTHEVTLYSDAKARCERFAICDANGNVVWYGRFFDDEGSEQSAAELEAALKAIWLASKIRNEVCRPGKTVRLNLFVDAQWLTTLSGKAVALSDAARRFNVELNIQWISGKTNPADKWTTASGFKKWGETDLKTLATVPGERNEAEIAEPQVEVEERSALPAPTQEQSKPENRSERGPEFQEWFVMMGADWPKLRDAWKAEGLSSRDRDTRLAQTVKEWVESGKTHKSVEELCTR